MDVIAAFSLERGVSLVITFGLISIHARARATNYSICSIRRPDRRHHKKENSPLIGGWRKDQVQVECLVGYKVGPTVEATLA
jgi:hypothetical protein